MVVHGYTGAPLKRGGRVVRFALKTDAEREARRTAAKQMKRTSSSGRFQGRK